MYSIDYTSTISLQQSISLKCLTLVTTIIYQVLRNYTKGRSYRRTFCLNFHFFFAQFFVFPYVLFSFPSIGLRSLPNVSPSVEFPNFGNVACFSCFSCFLGKKRGRFRKCCSIRTALRSTRYQVSRRKTDRERKKIKEKNEKWNKNKHYALREQAESQGDKVAVCWYGQSYDVSSWWTTKWRRKMLDAGQAKIRAETKPKKQE